MWDGGRWTRDDGRGTRDVGRRKAYAMKDKKQKHICPICKKETKWEENQFRPFCSDRCRLIDLGKWASDEYRIAGEKKDIIDENRGKNNHTEK